MKHRVLTIVCLALALVAFGCEKKAEEQANDEAEAEAPADEEKAEETDEAAGDEEAEAKKEDKAEEAKKLAKVEVPKEGKKFDPAIQAEQLPAKAFYCDMGTVHWAGMQKPEGGKCPECNMALKQYDPAAHAAKKKEAVEAKGDHGHDHGEGDHGHGHGGEEHDHGEGGHAH